MQTVARRYAAALADVVVDRKEEREVQQEVDQWASMIETNAELKEVFANPTVPYDEKQKVLEELIARTRVRPTTASFLRVLLRNQRLAQLKDVAERFGHVLDERGGVVSAHVTTARPLQEDMKNTVRETLAAATGRSVRVSFNIDETIIGGLVARIGSTIYDGSVQSRLDRLSEELAG
ncbi:MAG TPA: ATP synthase F1 subunit delta [Pyrinomonadaceae bacterium]|nr:ATP synthase F1 subunit delta [Pyrinomonadaceae bacterium]